MKMTDLTQPLTKEEIVASLRYIIQNLKLKAANCQDNLNHNFVYYFPSLGEEYYTLSYKLSLYNNLLQEVNTKGISSVDKQLSQLNSFLNSSCNVRSDSSNAFHREVSTLKYKANMEIRDHLASLLNI